MEGSCFRGGLLDRDQFLDFFRVVDAGIVIDRQSIPIRVTRKLDDFA